MKNIKSNGVRSIILIIIGYCWGLNIQSQIIAFVEEQKAEALFEKRVSFLNHTTTIKFSIAKEPTNDFLSTTIDETFCILPVTYTPTPVDTAQMHDTVYVKNNTSIVGNAFFCTIQGKPFLCTAEHCVSGWVANMKNIKSYSKQMCCGDISVIDYKSMIKNEKASCLKTLKSQPKHYKVNFNFPEHDSVFLEGYFPDQKDGRVKSLIVKGIGIKAYRQEFGFDIGSDQVILLKLSKKYIELRGVSGSPVLNSKGEVIGVASQVISGFAIGKDITRKECYLVISNFHH